MLRSICFLFFIFPFECLAQDTILARPFQIDTIIIENAPVDTVVMENKATEEKTKMTIPVYRKFYYGGFVNVTFGSYTVIGVEPSFAYKITPRFSVGTKLSYEYIHEKQGAFVYEESNYGFSLFSRMRVMPRLYTHVEYSSMNYKFYDDPDNSERKWVPFLFVGGGFSQPISENVWFNTEILFDVLQNENSPYNDWDPFYSVGFGVGF